MRGVSDCLLTGNVRTGAAHDGLLMEAGVHGI